MQIPAGLLADRISPKLLFGIGILGTNVLAIVFALGSIYPVMIATQAVAGVFRALLFIPGMLLITRHFRPERRATAMGLFVAGGFTSNIVVNLIGPVLVDPLGWQGVIVLSSVLGLGVLVAFWLLGDDGTPPEAHGTRVATRWVWRTRAWWLLAVVQFCRLSIVAGFGFWLPAFLIEDRGLALPVAGVIVAVSAALTAPANIGGGILSDRLGRPMLVIGAALGSLAVLLALLGFVHWLPALLILIGAISLVIQVYFGPLFAVPNRLFGPGLGGLSSGSETSGPTSAASSPCSCSACCATRHTRSPRDSGTWRRWPRSDSPQRSGSAARHHDRQKPESQPGFEAPRIPSS